MDDQDIDRTLDIPLNDMQLAEPLETAVERPHALAPAEALDAPLARSIASCGAKGNPGRMCVAVELYDARRYHRIPGLSWKINFTTVEDAKALLVAIDQAFKQHEAQMAQAAIGQIVPEERGNES